jgi:hypothetical protein
LSFSNISGSFLLVVLDGNRDGLEPLLRRFAWPAEWRQRQADPGQNTQARPPSKSRPPKVGAYVSAPLQALLGEAKVRLDRGQRDEHVKKAAQRSASAHQRRGSRPGARCATLRTIPSLLA